jgi:hypothetical protein
MRALETTSLTKFSNEEVRIRLARFLEYPKGWLEQDLLPDELLCTQAAEVLRELALDEESFLALPSDKTYGPGSEHFRAAAVMYWLKRERTRSITAALESAIAADPDKPMSRWLLKELSSQAN